MRLGPASHRYGLARRKADEKARSRPKWTARFFVAAANTNNVYSVGVSESKDLQMSESINVAMTPRQPWDDTERARDERGREAAVRRLLGCECSRRGRISPRRAARVLGFVPTGWYPTAVRSLADGRLIVLNGRGLRSLIQSEGPESDQSRRHPCTDGAAAIEYVGRMQTGTASVIDPFNDEQLDEYTKTVLRNSPYRDELLDRLDIPAGNPVPTRPGDPRPSSTSSTSSKKTAPTIRCSAIWETATAILR